MLLCFLPSSVLAQIGEALNGEENEALSDLSVSGGESAPYVLGEVEDRRTENTKTFRMSDGSYIVADYGKRIHFEDENGNLQDYDNSLAVSEVMTLDADDFAGAVNAESDVYVKLANNSNSNNLLKIQNDDYKISLHLVGADKSKALEIHTPEAEPVGNDIDSATTLHKFSSGAIYRDILPSVDLEYIIYGGTVKENIIVKEQLDSYNFAFELKLEGINPVLQSDGSIALNSATGAETVMVIPKGIMYDANGASSNAVEYAISHKNGNKYTLTVTASEEWINANERAFPVTVDPTFTPADNGANTEDIQISDSGTAYSYTESTITVGKSGSYQNQMLIKANTLPELPDSAVIVDAQLRLKKSSVTLGATIAAHIVTSEWSSSTVTWADKPNSSTTVIDYHTINAAAAAAEYHFDITKAAQYWYREDKNTGVLLAPLSSGGTGSVTFYSSDYSNLDNKPLITVTYRDTKGIEGRWTFSAQGAGNAGTGYVNGFNGNLVFAHADMATEGSVIPITVSHIYNSFQADLEFTAGESINAPKTADFSNMKVGKGWKLSVQQTVIKEIIDSETYYVYNDSDGTERYFKEVNGIYVDEDGNGLTLTVSGSGEDTEYVIENETDTEYIFDYTGKLTYIVDVHGNKKRFSYNDNGSLFAIYYQPVEVDLQQQLVFAYNTEGALKQITNAYNTNDYVQFLYSETISGTPSVNDSGYLREIRYYNGTTLLNTVYYEYYTYAGIESEGKTGALKSAKDGDTGYMLEYKYDTYEGRFRVALAKESVNGIYGQTVGFEYEDKLFTVRTSGRDDIYGSGGDNDDIFTHTLFDDYGSAICSYSQFVNGYDVLGASYAEYMPYEAAAETNYKIKTSAVKGITNNNLLYNPNCEPSSAWTKTVGGDGYTASFTTDAKYFGTGALKLASTEGGVGFASYTDSVYLTAGTYTLSAYVKLVNVQSTNGGFYLRCVNSGDYKTGTTNTAIDNGWQRISHTFTVTSAGYYDVVFSLEKATGTAYIDCAQLEKGESPSDYNFIENGGFDSARKWSGTYTLTNGRATLNGSPTAQNRITQTIALNSPINSTFMLSGWAEASSVSLTTSENRKFGVVAKLTYSDNSTDEFELSFNPDNANRQYASTAIVPKKTDTALTVTSIEISVAYDYNANTAYFDDIALTVEPAQTYAYDDEGNLSTATDIEGNESVMHYHENGIDLKDYTAITGESFDYTYNSKHQVTTASKTVGNTTQTASYTYDNYGNITGVTLSAGGSLKVTSSAVYSDYGNYLTESINELGETTSYNYDSVTKLLKYVENANNVHTAYTYDNRDRTTKVYLDADKDGIADTAEAQVAYLYANNRLSGIDTATTDYTLTYDAFGNVLTIKAGNYTLATYEYASNNGKLLKLTYGNGDYEEYIYDSLERLVEVKLNGATEYVVKYDNNGRLYSLTENGATHIYEYDSLDRLVRAWQEDTNGNYIVAVENSYDDLGRAKGSTYVVGDRTMAYEINYRPNSNLVNYISMPAAGVQSNIGYTYDEFERVTRKQHSFSNAINFCEEYQYYSYTDAEGAEHTTSLVSSLSFGGNSSGTTSAVYSYIYDNLGNITQIKKDGVIINEYTYDSLGQLVCEEDAVTGVTYIYYYDKSGNITQKDEYP
ncbi:MAG: RHS repeat protein, partial [Clostridia bacterium]|nr:RHS repeat protein [Clostridia bacterium]